MAHKDIAFRLFNLWKKQQLEVIHGVNVHGQYEFGYRSTLEQTQWFLESSQNRPLDEFCQDLMDLVLNRLSKDTNSEVYAKGAKKALCDFLILMGKIPPICLSDCSYIGP